MKSNQTAPLLVTLAPALAAAPPLLIGGAIVLGLIWLFSEKEESAMSPAGKAAPASVHTETDASKPKAANKRVTREDVAEALEYGARTMTRTEVVAALQALGFRKTAAYKALLPDGRFGELVEVTPDGLVTWQG